jgi:hypothetical protein
MIRASEPPMKVRLPTESDIALIVRAPWFSNLMM